MIGFLRGTIDCICEDRVLIDVNGVGYNVYMSASSIGSRIFLGDEVKLYTHMSVREDSMTLFGFLSAEELGFFKMLIGVNGVGPKFALGLLSTFTTADLKVAILSMDAKTIAKAPGIGMKSAQKIILELKDKISLEDIALGKMTGINEPSGAVSLTENMQDAIDALCALGYSPTSSLKAVRGCALPDGSDSETIIKAALKIIAR